MDYDWVSNQILSADHAEAVSNILIRHENEVKIAWDRGYAKILGEKEQAEQFATLWQKHAEKIGAEWQLAREALRAIAEHGDGLARVVAELALKEN